VLPTILGLLYDREAREPVGGDHVQWREWMPDVFQPEESRDFRLQAKGFGRTLYSWESDWVNTQLEAELEGWLDRLGDLLKRWDNPPPGEESAPADL
jgi:hypothetical protein